MGNSGIKVLGLGILKKGFKNGTRNGTFSKKTRS